MVAIRILLIGVAAYILLSVGAEFANGQTLSPVIVECGKKCNGHFTITNDGIIPLTVAVEPHSFSFDATGKTVMRPLDSTTHVELQDMSSRIGPKQVHQFDYSVVCDSATCAVILVSKMIVGHATNGIAFQVVLLHTIYSCVKQKGCRDQVRHAAGL